MRARATTIAALALAITLAPAATGTAAANAGRIPDSGWTAKGSAKCTPSLLRVLFISSRCG